MHTTIQPWIFLTGVFHIPPQKMGKRLYKMRMARKVTPPTILRYVARDSIASDDLSRKPNRGPTNLLFSLASTMLSVVEVVLSEAMRGRVVKREKLSVYHTAGARCLITRHASRQAGNDVVLMLSACLQLLTGGKKSTIMSATALERVTPFRTLFAGRYL